MSATVAAVLAAIITSIGAKLVDHWLAARKQAQADATHAAMGALGDAAAIRKELREDVASLRRQLEQVERDLRAERDRSERLERENSALREKVGRLEGIQQEAERWSGMCAALQRENGELRRAITTATSLPPEAPRDGR